MSDEAKIVEVLGKNKHQQLFIAGAIVLVLFGLIFILLFRQKQPPPKIPEQPVGSLEEEINKMNQLREEVYTKPLKENTLAEEVAELNAKRPPTSLQPETDLKTEIDNMNALRPQL